MILSLRTLSRDISPPSNLYADARRACRIAREKKVCRRTADKGSSHPISMGKATLIRRDSPIPSPFRCREFMSRTFTSALRKASSRQGEKIAEITLRERNINRSRDRENSFRHSTSRYFVSIYLRGDRQPRIINRLAELSSELSDVEIIWSRCIYFAKFILLN